jgi:hypothetical protein
MSDVSLPPSVRDVVDWSPTHSEAAQLTVCDDELVRIRSCPS